MSNLVAIAYDDLGTAQQVVSNLGRAQAAHEIELDDLVIVERRGDGKVKRKVSASKRSISACR